jgi:hypothetical protein
MESPDRNCRHGGQFNSLSIDQQIVFPRIVHGLAFGIHGTCGECGKKLIRVYTPMYTLDPEKDPYQSEKIAGGGLPEAGPGKPPNG